MSPPCPAPLGTAAAHARRPPRITDVGSGRPQHHRQPACSRATRSGASSTPTAACLPSRRSTTPTTAGHVLIRTSEVSRLLRKVPTRSWPSRSTRSTARPARAGASSSPGRARSSPTPETLGRSREARPHPWAAGDRNVVLQIATTIVTGYQIADHRGAGGAWLEKLGRYVAVMRFARRPPHRPHRRHPPAAAIADALPPPAPECTASPTASVPKPRWRRRWPTRRARSAGSIRWCTPGCRTR